MGRKGRGHTTPAAGLSALISGCTMRASTAICCALRIRSVRSSEACATTAAASWRCFAGCSECMSTAKFSSRTMRSSDMSCRHP